MSRSSILVILGVLTLLIPFSGLPSSMRSLLDIAFGASVIGIGIWLRSRDMQKMSASVPPLPAPAAPSETQGPPPPPTSVSPI